MGLTMVANALSAEARHDNELPSDNRTREIIEAVTEMMVKLGFNRSAFEKLTEGELVENVRVPMNLAQLLEAD